MSTYDAQRREALVKANDVRHRRAVLRRELADAPSRSAALVAVRRLLDGSAPDWLHSMPVAALLLACRGVGTVMAGRVLRGAGIGPSSTLGQLSARQHLALTHALATLNARGGYGT